MSEFVLIGQVERFGVEPDGHSNRFSTVLAESHHYAKLRIRDLEADLERLRGACKDLSLLCERMSRATNLAARSDLVGHARRIAKSVGCGPSVMREAARPAGGE